ALAISRHLVEMMGGRFDLAAEPEEGATVSFVAEFETTGETGFRAVDQLGVTLTGVRVLVASTDFTFREFIARILRHEGLNVTTANNWQDALLAQENEISRFDMGILETDLADARPADLLEAIADMPLNLKGRLLTVFPDRAQMKRFTAIRLPGMPCTVAMPLTRNELVSQIAVLLGRETTRTEARGIDGPRRRLSVVRSDTARILMAEDNPVLRRITKRQLERMGYSVDAFPDGAKAFAAWRVGGYSLVMTDIQMPSIDGFELTRLIRAAETGARVPIIAISANPYKQYAGKCLEIGMDDYVQKPVDPKTLLKALKKWAPVPPVEEDEAVPLDIDLTPEGRTSPVDYKALQSLFVGADVTFLHRMLKQFVGVGGQMVESMSDSMAGDTPEEVARVAGKLKTSAGSIGAHRLAEVSADIEHIARGGDRTDLDRHFSELVTEFRSLSDYIHLL
ncbi:MAG: response regulator, partial [Pseudomonadota bacterium]|nr:response regulator [Pseudomonadota bacterium]